MLVSSPPRPPGCLWMTAFRNVSPAQTVTPFLTSLPRRYAIFIVDRSSRVGSNKATLVFYGQMKTVTKTSARLQQSTAHTLHQDSALQRTKQLPLPLKNLPRPPRQTRRHPFIHHTHLLHSQHLQSRPVPRLRSTKLCQSHQLAQQVVNPAIRRKPL